MMSMSFKMSSMSMVKDEYELQVSQLSSMSMVNDEYELQDVEYEYGE